MPTDSKIEVVLGLVDGTKITRVETLTDVTAFLEQHKEFVNVVRCKDCKHWAMHSWCSRLAPFDKVYMGADDYCSKGKRMDEVTE